MKKILLLLTLCACVFNAEAQISDSAIVAYTNQVDTMTVEFTAPIGTECYVANYVNDPSIILQVALATDGIVFTDSLLNNDAITATIAVKGRTIVKCFQVLRSMPEGYCADENKKLLNALIPAIASSPALYYVITKMRNDNASTLMDVKRAGANKVIELQKVLY
jgi:hypothetical protein